MKKAFGLIVLLFLALQALATPTRLIVRAKAKDAKFIGSSIGGAYVMIKEKQTGRIMAEGQTEGGTGNTGLIMRTPRERYQEIAVGNTAKFEATFDIEEPVFVTIEVLAPVNQKQATVAASTEIWLIPGKDIVGDGIVLEIPGFIVNVLQPRTHQFIGMEDLEDNTIEFQANIVMMCGCTISEGGLWDSGKMEVRAMIKLNGELIGEAPLNQHGAPNLFSGRYRVEKPGNYEVIVYAYQPESGNTGVDKVNYNVGE